MPPLYFLTKYVSGGPDGVLFEQPHFVRSIRMKWESAIVYFTGYVLCSERICKIIFDYSSLH